MRPSPVIAVAGAVLFALASTARAQGHPQRRPGFTVSIGAGTGTAGVSCDDCGDDRQTGPTGYLRIGGAIKPNLILAGEANGWTKSRNGETFTISTLTALLQWYPQVSTGFYLAGGLGFGYLRAEVETNVGTLSNTGSGFGYQVGTGYDIRLGKNFSLTPFATYFATTGVQFDTALTKADGNVFHFGLGLTWH